MITLNGTWQMNCKGEDSWQEGQVPGTVYTDLLRNGQMKDPYVGENEDEVRDLSYNDYTYRRTFEVEEKTLQNTKNVLVCEGLDTLADVYLNGTHMGSCENMHRTYRFDVTELLKAGTNEIVVELHSPLKYMEEQYEKRPLWGVSSTVPGYQHIRKAHCMFGWDWGPKLPDLGIWRSIYIEEIQNGRIESVYLRQKLSGNEACLTVEVENEIFTEAEGMQVVCIVTAPDGSVAAEKTAEAEKKQSISISIPNPKFWWPNGYGEQNLYRVSVELRMGDTTISKQEMNCGFRDFRIAREKDRWGESFCFCINGKKIFARGANYIPEDSILGKCSKERTRQLLTDCKTSNYNCIRVWGGGHYPDTYFYDLCDELGLVVWEDFMFACAVYDLTDELEANLAAEAKDNILRLRNHPSLGLWCGNNEMEGAWLYWGIPQDEKLRQDYTTMFERLIPQWVRTYDPDRFYWPSSPSAGGGFIDPCGENSGDTHYWDVWHGKKPFEDVETKYFRFFSEYGFEGIPSRKTLREVIAPDQFNLASPEMEKHQKCIDNGPGNVTLMFYLLKRYLHPQNFDATIYTTQCLQADFLEMAIRHLRSHKERCAGSTYWQVNDTYPTISWATIDYYGRWKGAQYVVKRSYAPQGAYVEADEWGKAELYVYSEALKPEKLTYRLALMEQGQEPIREACGELTLEPLSSAKAVEWQLPKLDQFRRRDCYLHYEIAKDGIVIDSGNRLLEMPKAFRFRDPKLETKVEEKNGKIQITVTAQEFARRVGLELKEADVIFSDNFFDLLPGESRVITVEEVRSAEHIDVKTVEEELIVWSNYQIGRE